MARPRGNYAVTAARRLAILDAALKVFGQSGYNGGSLKQIAEIVGISEAGILHHFKTKSELLISVLEYRDESTQALFTGEENNEPLMFVVDWFRLLQYNMANKGIVELYAMLSGEATAPSHPANKYFRDRYEMVREWNTLRFERLVASGHLIEGAPGVRDLALWIAALSDGLQVQWLLNRDVDMLAETESFFRTIMKPASWMRMLEIYEQMEPFADQLPSETVAVTATAAA